MITLEVIHDAVQDAKADGIAVVGIECTSEAFHELIQDAGYPAGDYVKSRPKAILGLPLAINPNIDDEFNLLIR